MPVIALTQEMGSLAKDVALRLAEVGGLAEMRNEVVDNVAGRMQVPASLVRRLREGKAGFVERLSTDKEQVALFTAEELFAQAVRGNVVLRGWGATVLLRPVSHVVRVRVTRPFEQRVAWLMEHLGTDDRDAAESEVRRSDNAHAQRMNAQFGVTWGDPLLYDMVLNTDRLSVDSCADMILQLARRPEFQETADSRATLEGLALSAHVRAALKANESTSNVDVQIESRNGRVTLNGIVVNEHEKAEAERVASGVAGIGKVDNQLHLMKVTRKFTYAKT
ncbi:cytidylate kinase family protein [Ramlibacter sp. USB13]|uniref:Cytidylate kinase family protein n=1 Tax=Ramlibacter cellulosilyticus TaxID=2764187 RepID=A0A923SAW3_9BURK|nr:cytidylate kinase family protein [Ramlibacter cellulosilyticus]MBC5783205.1 cytidylate kinase family protein [Ramlibacter cellulosilyticus]